MGSREGLEAMTGTSVVADGSAAADVPQYPMPRAVGRPLDPPPGLRELEAGAPVTRVRWWDSGTPWLVTRYQDQRALLVDPRISADSSHPNFPPVSHGHPESQRQLRSYLRMDDPEHLRLRMMVNPWLSVKQAEALRPAIQAIVDSQIADLLAGPRPVDLSRAFAVPVASLVVCKLLGMPYADLQSQAPDHAALMTRNATPEQAQGAQRRLFGYLDSLLGDKLANPGDDLMSGLAARVRAGELSRDDAANMGVQLLRAGHDTTANMITLGTLALLQHPDQLAILRETDDPRVIAGAVEEMLRFLSIVQHGVARVALADIEIGGQVIRAGDGVFFRPDVANRDPDLFPDPDRLDLRRNARRHIAFGFGTHQCQGQNLARVELAVVYGTLYKRIPTLGLAVSLDQLRFKHDEIAYGVHELPVTW
jgi:cytochrome P450